MGLILLAKTDTFKKKYKFESVIYIHFCKGRNKIELFTLKQNFVATIFRLKQELCRFFFWLMFHFVRAN